MKLNSVSNEGYGGSGGFTFGLAYMDLSYVNDLLLKETSMSTSPIYGKNLQLDLKNGKYSTMPLVGGFGVGGVGNGIRIGGGGYGLTQIFELYDTDTLYEALVSMGYGGLIIQKGFVFGRNNLVIGTLLGAGGTDFSFINKYVNKGKSSAFDGDRSDGEESNSFSNARNAQGGFFVTELSLRYSYSFLPWMHLGVNGGTSFINSIDYDTSYGSYFTVNPFGKIEFIFGNLG